MNLTSICGHSQDLKKKKKKKTLQIWLKNKREELDLNEENDSILLKDIKQDLRPGKMGFLH